MYPYIPKRSEPRYETPLIAYVIPYKWIPFFKIKVVILDLSWNGFKIEFPEKLIKKLRYNSILSIEIKINQFNISTITKIKLKLIIKWFNLESRRAGGIFARPRGEKAIVLGNLIQKLAILKQKEDDVNLGSKTYASTSEEEAS